VGSFVVFFRSDAHQRCPSSQEAALRRHCGRIRRTGRHSLERKRTARIGKMSQRGWLCVVIARKMTWYRRNIPSSHGNRPNAAEHPANGAVRTTKTGGSASVGPRESLTTRGSERHGSRHAWPFGPKTAMRSRCELSPADRVRVQPQRVRFPWSFPHSASARRCRPRSPPAGPRASDRSFGMTLS
jgi:hypothetical protein